MFPKEDYEHKGLKEKAEEEARFGDYPNNLVRRPKKGFLWGLGTQTFTSKHFKINYLLDEKEENESEYFTMYKLPTIRQIIRFLEIHQWRQIKVIDCRQLNISHLSNYAILSSWFSARHLHHVSKTLVSEIKKVSLLQENTKLFTK